jgi:hypothetical protein
VWRPLQRRGPRSISSAVEGKLQSTVAYVTEEGTVLCGSTLAKTNVGTVIWVMEYNTVARSGPLVLERTTENQPKYTASTSVFYS